MFKSLLHLVFPKICYSCGNPLPQNLSDICLACRDDLARLNIREFENNPIQQIFWGRIDLQRATSYLKFEQNGKLQTLLHFLKYKGNKEIGTTLGEMAALEIGTTNFFDQIDLIVPIPIHKIKKQKRGYNQSDYIAEGISNITELKVDNNNVEKIINTASQTRKSRYDRYKNVSKTFAIKNIQAFENKHILIVDDVLTTGATIEAFGNELKKIDGVKLSLLTIAYTN